MVTVRGDIARKMRNQMQLARERSFDMCWDGRKRDDATLNSISHHRGLIGKMRPRNPAQRNNGIEACDGWDVRPLRDAREIVRLGGDAHVLPGCGKASEIEKMFKRRVHSAVLSLGMGNAPKFSVPSIGSHVSRCLRAGHNVVRQS